MGIKFTYFGFIKEYYGKNVTDKLSTVPDDLLCFGLQGSSDKKYIDEFVIMHHCVRSVSFGSRVLLVLILFYTLPLLQTPAADINDSRECLGLTSKMYYLYEFSHIRGNQSTQRRLQIRFIQLLGGHLHLL